MMRRRVHPPISVNKLWLIRDNCSFYRNYKKKIFVKKLFPILLQILQDIL